MSDTVPDGWMERPLSELLDSLESGSRPKGGVRGIAKGVPSIGGEHLSYSGKFDFSNIKYVPEAFAEKMKRGRIQLNDILIVKDGATTGKTSFVDQYFPFQKAVVNEHVFICRPSREANAKYLFWFLFGKEGQDRILENFKGSAQGGINTTFAPNTLVPVAPLLEQERIVHQLDTLMAKLDSARDRLDKVPQILRRFRQAVLTVAINGQLTEDWRRITKDLETSVVILDRIKAKRLSQAQTQKKRAEIEEAFSHCEQGEHFDLPVGWQFITLKKIAGQFQYGSSQKSVNSGKVPVLRMGNIQNGKIDWTDLKFSNDDVEIGQYLLRKGDLLFNRTNSPELVGKTAIYCDERPAIFAGYLIRIADLQDVLPEYLNYCLNSAHAKQWCMSVKTDGVSQSNINAQKLAEFEVPFCSLLEQLEIVRRVEKLFAVADQIEKRYRKAKTFTDKLPQAVLAKAFRGELNLENEKTEKST